MAAKCGGRAVLTWKKGHGMQALGLVWGQDILPGLEEIHIDKAMPVHRGARLLLAQWQARENEGRFVVGRDVPTRALASILSGLVLYEPVTDDFRIRLAGLGLHRRFGRDVTGERLSALLGAAQFHAHAERMHDLLRSGRPLVVEVRLMEEGRIYLCFEMVAVRVFAPDGETPWVLAGLFFSDWRL